MYKTHCHRLTRSIPAQSRRMYGCNTEDCVDVKHSVQVNGGHWLLNAVTYATTTGHLSAGRVRLNRKANPSSPRRVAPERFLAKNRPFARVHMSRFVATNTPLAILPYTSPYCISPLRTEQRRRIFGRRDRQCRCWLGGWRGKGKPGCWNNNRRVCRQVPPREVQRSGAVGVQSFNRLANGSRCLVQVVFLFPTAELATAAYINVLSLRLRCRFNRPVRKKNLLDFHRSSVGQRPATQTFSSTFEAATTRRGRKSALCDRTKRRANTAPPAPSFAESSRSRASSIIRQIH